MTYSQINAMNANDNRLYAVIHTASDYLSWQTIEKDFVAQFKFGDEDKCIFIVDVDTIISPLFVFKNFGGSDSDKGNYFCEKFFLTISWLDRGSGQIAL